MEFIDLKRQQQRIRADIDAAIGRVLDHGCYIMGPEVAALEALLADYVGVRHAIACSSGTDALLLSLMSYGVGAGDAVFTTPFTFFATAEAIVLTGATPVFVDIDPVTFNIDPAKLAQACRRLADRATGPDGTRLTPRGIVAVDLFGLPADYPELLQFAEAHDLFVVEDAAQSFGAELAGRRAPGLAHVGATSFFPAKPLGCYGDGGAVFTDDDLLADRVRSLLSHGKGADKYNNVRIGLNARLDTLQAAILIEKLRIYPEENALRQELADAYAAALAPGAGRLAIPRVAQGARSAWAQYTIRCPERDLLQVRLKERGIPSMVYYVQPLHLLEALAFLGHRRGDFPVAEAAAATVLSLPFHPYLKREALAEVCAKVLEAVLSLPSGRDVVV